MHQGYSVFVIRCDDQTNWFSLIGTKIIAGLVLIGTKAKVFWWYDLRTKYNWWWRNCGGREALLEMVADVGAVATVEIWDNNVEIK